MPDNSDARFERIETTLERITQRLDGLTERHQALAQTVEILAGMQRAAEERMEQNERRLGQLMDAFTRLVTIVESHERRLDNLEGQ